MSLGVERLPTVRDNDPIRVFEITFNARAKHFRHQGIGHPQPAPAGLIFISRTNAAQRCAYAFIA